MAKAWWDPCLVWFPQIVKFLLQKNKQLYVWAEDGVWLKTKKLIVLLYLVLCSFRLVIYGQYCSQVETAISCLDNISKTKEDVKLKLEVWGMTFPLGYFLCFQVLQQKLQGFSRKGTYLLMSSDSYTHHCVKKHTHWDSYKAVIFNFSSQGMLTSC